MRTKATVTVIVVTAVMVLGLLTVSYADNKTKPQHTSAGKTQMGKDAGQGQKDIMKDLNLTPEQQEKLKKQGEANQEKLKNLHEQLQAKRMALKTELEKADWDKGKIMSLTAEIKNLFGQVLDLRTQSVFFIKETLTREQFAKFQQKVQERRSMMKKQVDQMRQKMGNKPPQNPEAVEEEVSRNP